ncbi:DUF1501 domain-containing protein [Gemmatimonas sp.]|uniref:DUF1501 domain-containing protein n=1 Tax=Gemmatimonas sp. TaxID=1962908 RepID=UPI0039833A89
MSHGHGEGGHDEGCGVNSQPRTRREALRTMGAGFGMMAFAQMVGASIAEASSSVLSSMGERVIRPHFKPRAKNVIFLFMNGGVSQVDTFDPKPELDKYDGKPIPNAIKTERKTGSLMKSPFKFSRYGKSGLEVSELFPEVGGIADDICVIRSMHTEIPNHEPSLLMMNTGHIQPGRPSMGAWLTYGLGTENKNLPGFVVLCPDQPTVVGPPLWSNGFLPAMHQGTFISDKTPRLADDFDPYELIPNIHSDSTSLSDQRSEVDLVEKLNRMRMQRVGPHDEELEGAIKAMETAYRMQTDAPDVFDIRKESEATQRLYGPGSTARGCLTAVRLVEKGVRMVQVYYAKGDPWDHHDDINKHRINARNSDRAFAAVVKDLKSRGLLDDTLVVCGTEFGRTPVLETGGGGAGGRVTNGRDHNPFGFSIWLAGGGVKGGITYGRTDDFGFKVVENPVHIHDLHATILHLLGINHEKLTYNYSGRDFRLTDVAGKVIHDIIA